MPILTETYRIKDVLDAAENHPDIETIESALRIREVEIDRFFDGDGEGLSLNGLREESRRLYDSATRLYNSGQSLKKRARILLAISKMLNDSALMPAPAYQIADYINKVEEIVKEWESSRNRDVATTSAIFQNLVSYCSILGDDANPRWRQLINREAEAAYKDYTWEGMATSVVLYRLSFLAAYANSLSGTTGLDLLSGLITHYADTILGSPEPKPRQLVQLSDIIMASGSVSGQTIVKLHDKISSLLPLQAMPSIRLVLESCLLKNR